MNTNWFFSRKIRHADQMAKHVRKILNAQRDILSPDAIQNVERSLAGLCAAVRGKVNHGAVDAKMTELETVANKWLKQYPNPGLRENVEVLLVAIAVAMAIRTFFIQPFKIPTGSMQPTLYGITPNAYDQQITDFTVPNPVVSFFDFWFRGISTVHELAKEDGTLEAADPTPRKFLLFNLVQSFRVSGRPYRVWFPPDDLFIRAGFVDHYGHVLARTFKKGEDLIKLQVISGDHLFVDRLTYNFRKPTLGEIIVFQTKGIEGLPQDQFYIKRLVALGGDQIGIGNDRHIVLNGKRLDASTPHFENVYSFQGPPKRDAYSGHVNEAVAHELGQYNLAPRFTNEETVVTVPLHHYMVMGDNTLNSSDSRIWGDFPEENVIGKSFFVYWPIGRQDDRPSRFGWGTR